MFSSSAPSLRLTSPFLYKNDLASQHFGYMVGRFRKETRDNKVALIPEAFHFKQDDLPAVILYSPATDKDRDKALDPIFLSCFQKKKTEAALQKVGVQLEQTANEEKKRKLAAKFFKTILTTQLTSNIKKAGGFKLWATVLLCYKRLERFRKEWQLLFEEIVTKRQQGKPITKPLLVNKARLDSMIHQTGTKGHTNLKKIKRSVQTNNWSLHAASVNVLNQFINRPQDFPNWRAVYKPKEQTFTLKPDDGIAVNTPVKFNKPLVTA